jgi:hypothetical protein
MYNFHVGQKVVCVDAFVPRSPWLYPSELVEGDTYVLRWVGMFEDMDHATQHYLTALNHHFKTLDLTVLHVRLVGVRHDEVDIPFTARRFRPLVTTDISIFTRFLEPSHGTILDLVD